MVTMQTLLDLTMWTVIVVMLGLALYNTIIFVRTEQEARRQERERDEPWQQLNRDDDRWLQ